MTATLARPHALYRFYGRDHALLYVGLTLDPSTRWKNHSKAKPWWLDVSSIRIEHFPDRASVEVAERLAIQQERPRFNLTHNTEGDAKAQARADNYFAPRLARRLIHNETLSTYRVTATPPPFGQWLVDIVETGHGYDHLAFDLLASPTFRTSMSPGHVEVVLHTRGLHDTHGADFIEARQIHNYLNEIAQVELRTDVYDLRADLEQIWSSRRIWIWHGAASVVRLDRHAYVDLIGDPGRLPARFRTLATACLSEGYGVTSHMAYHPAAAAGVDDRAVGLVVPRRHIGDAVDALVAAELDRDLDPLRLLCSALPAGSVR